MPDFQTIEVPVAGMDCADCTMHVQKAISSLPGVEGVEVFLAAEKAVVRLDAEAVDLPAIRRAVERAGYSVPDLAANTDAGTAGLQDFTRPIMALLGVVFGVVLFVVVVGEWLGLFEAITSQIPWFVGLGIVLVGGYPVFVKVVRAALNRQIISHTLMTLGVIAALAVGEWATAAVVVFFMRVGDYVESFTAERARRAVKDLTEIAPRMARIERQGEEIETPIEQVSAGDIVIVRPGEMIPVDGEVTGGQATVDQSSITGESLPVEAGPGASVYAATLVNLGSLHVRTTHVGPDSTYGRVISLVEQAEAHKADVQRIADRFSAYYLPLVAGIAALTYLIRRDPLATAAVLLVACSCSFALATPIAMLASIGAGAKRGLMIKGGKYLEILAKADVLLIDKTGTLTLGKPEITEIVGIANSELGIRYSESGIRSSELGTGEYEAKISHTTLASPSSRLVNPNSSLLIHNSPLAILQLAASAERYSEHPLAQAVRVEALKRGLELYQPLHFEALPGLGVRAEVNGQQVSVGSRRFANHYDGVNGDFSQRIARLEAEGKTLLLVSADGQVLGALAAADTLRPEVPLAIGELRSLGIQQIELITGDSQEVARTLAGQLGVKYRAGLLPEDKIRVVQEYQSQGHTVIMVGDGVNDAPALAQADVGIAMGVAGSAIAVEAADIALMRDDWTLVPQALLIARRTMRVVKVNIAFTALYNLVGLSLAALGYLPPVLAAAAQSVPDLIILGNSSRLLRQKE